MIEYLNRIQTNILTEKYLLLSMKSLCEHKSLLTTTVKINFNPITNFRGDCDQTTYLSDYLISWLSNVEIDIICTLNLMFYAFLSK